MNAEPHKTAEAIPEPSNPENWTLSQLADAAEQLHNAISVAAREGLPVNYLGLIKQHCEYQLFTKNTKQQR